MTLHLHVKSVYFFRVLKGLKVEEYRQRNDYWSRIITVDGVQAKEFDSIVYYNGFFGGEENRLVLPWRGFRFDSLVVDLFGSDAESVFAIPLDLEAFGPEELTERAERARKPKGLAI